MLMLLEQVYLLYIYILFIELAMVTVVAIALFVALIVTINKLDSKKKHISAWPLEMYFTFKILSSDMPRSVVSRLPIFIILKNI